MTVTGYIRVVLRSFIDFLRDGGLMLAGSLSYFSMMAIVPFCLLLVAIFGYFLGEERGFYEFFQSRLVSYFPTVTSEITEELRRLITFKGLGKFSLIIYGFLSYELFSSLESAITVVFKMKTKRHFIISLILSLIIITLIIAILIISFAATSVISMLKPIREVFPGLEIGGITGFLLGFVIPFALMLVTVAVLYIFLPRRRVRFSHAFSGALFTALFLEAAKHLFTLYVLNVFKLGTIYGPLSAFVMFLLWVFYSACIFLIGAEVVHNLEQSRGK